MGWAARANGATYSTPKVQKDREHFKEPEFKAQWATFLERVGTHIPTPRLRKRVVAAVRRVFTYRKRAA